MKITRKSIIPSAALALVFAFSSQNLRANEEGWITDFDAALKQATEQSKDVYVNFTGSDW